MGILVAAIGLRSAFRLSDADFGIRSAAFGYRELRRSAIDAALLPGL